MHYYSHNIADFNHATRHLDRVERSIYRDLIELYYDLEGPLPNDLPQLCRRICARRDDEPQVVEAMLAEFFTLTEAGWVHERCEKEISAYRSKAEKAQASAAKRWQSEVKEVQQCERNANAMPTHSERNANQEPITNNHKPVTNKKTKAPDGVLPDGVDPQVAADFIALSAKQRAPITATRLAGIEREARKVGMSLEAALRVCCERNWRGFKAEWIANQRPPPTYQTAADKRQSFAEALTGRTHERATPDFIDLN